MKIFLRDGATGCYYGGASGWTPEREQAHDFRLIEEAVLANKELGLGATHIILNYDLPACNVSLPITNYSDIGIASSHHRTEHRGAARQGAEHGGASGG